MKIGDVAGTRCGNGYISVFLEGRRYAAHRLAWFYVNKEWPEFDVDHINRVRTDNRICNLRMASRTENNQNTVETRRNTSGVKGVSRSKTPGKWVARIRVERRDVHLGTYSTIEDAKIAYGKAASEWHKFNPSATC